MVAFSLLFITIVCVPTKLMSLVFHQLNLLFGEVLSLLLWYKSKVCYLKSLKKGGGGRKMGKGERIVTVFSELYLIKY